MSVVVNFTDSTFGALIPFMQIAFGVNICSVFGAESTATLRNSRRNHNYRMKNY